MEKLATDIMFPDKTVIAFKVLAAFAIAFAEMATNAETPVLQDCDNLQRATLVDFTRVGHGWVPEKHLKDARQTAAGYVFTANGEDPICMRRGIEFPVLPPTARFVRFELVVAPCNAKSFQVFRASGGKGFTEESSFWLEAAERVPGCTHYSAEISAADFPQGMWDFRIDPPGGTDTYTLKSLIVTFLSPLWTYHPSPARSYSQPVRPIELSGRNWLLRHDASRMGAFTFISAGHCTAEHNAEEPVEWVDRNGKAQSVLPASLPMKADISADGKCLNTSVSWTDSDGRTWRLSRRFSGAGVDWLDVDTRIEVSKPVRLLHMPWLTMLVDRESCGHKVQALLPGIEYLEDESSSNTKDVRTADANRLIPSACKLCYPLMLLTQKTGWTCLAWELPQPGPASFSPVFDSPDRVFKSGGHLFALWSPAVGNGRRESELDIFTAKAFSGGMCNAKLRAGAGSTVSDALVDILPPNALPELPQVSPNDYFTTLARGWLDSAIRKDGLFRHATVFDCFKFAPAADAPALLRWLAAVMPDASTKSRLLKVARSAMEALPEEGERRGWGNYISHIRRPVAPLVYGDTYGYARAMDDQAAWFLRDIKHGFRKYVAPKDGLDYSSTLGTNHCNGLTAILASETLRSALWTGDEAKISAVLAVLDKMTALYSSGIPRGAQPWEVPLHAPDICASANMLHCYVYGFLLRPDPKYLREARAWARTGLTMVYLEPARGIGPIGRYATIGVMGSSNWGVGGCCWFGRPVQWCGLTYAAALFELAKIDPDPVQAAYWRKVAKGITASGQQQCHPVEDGPHQGLLPDSFNLVAQTRFMIPINPGTLQENAAEAIGRPYYTVAHPVKGRPELMHVPGGIKPGVPRDGECLRCRVVPWPEEPFRIVISRVARPRSVTWNGREVPFKWEGNVLVVELTPAPGGDLVLR